MDEQAAILAKHADFIVTLPGPVMESAPPDWLPVDPVKKSTVKPD
jgi:hypothetical protein